MAAVTICSDFGGRRKAPDSGIEPVFLAFPALADGFFTTAPPGILHILKYRCSILSLKIFIAAAAAAAAAAGELRSHPGDRLRRWRHLPTCAAQRVAPDHALCYSPVAV